MKPSLLLIAMLPFSVISLTAADLPPDKGNEIPESSKRPVVVTLTKSQVSDLKSQLPKADLPKGFELQTVAAPPLVTHPIMGSLDDRGRLFVGDAVGVNWNKQQLEANPPNRVLMLEDTDGDGFYDKSTIFADKMTFPQGGCWLDGSLYVCSPPGIWKLTDTDGDGVADKREQIVTGFEYTGNAADVHGPWLHPNGRLYWCHGRKGHKVVGKEGTVVHEGLASGIWSCKPDGSDVRWHSLGCGDNPVKVDFTPEGEIIGVENLYYTAPRGDTIVHWQERGVYERSDQLKAIEGMRRAVEHMPVMHNFGHVAVSGCCFSKSGALPPGNPLQLFVTHFNTQRIVRMELTPEGATYKAAENEFLQLHDPDIHLTDVLEDADGSLLALNTGGWFRIGCPASLMAKPDALGAVYRVKRKAAANPTTARRSAPAYHEWEPSGDAEILARLKDKANPKARLEACRALRLYWKGGNNDFFVALHDMFTEPLDPILEYAAIMAFVDQEIAHQGYKVSSNPALSDSERDLQEKRMILVQSYFAGTPDAAQPEKELERATAFLKKAGEKDAAVAYQQALGACLFVISRVREAPGVLRPAFDEWLKTTSLDSARLQIIEASLSGRLGSPASQQTLAALLTSASSSAQQVALRQLAAQSSTVVNDSWLPPLEKMLDEAPTHLLLDAIKKLKSPRFDEKLQALASEKRRPLSIRLKALDSMKGVKLVGDSFVMVKGVLGDATSSPAARIQAATMLASAPLDKEQQLAIAPLFASVGPVELDKLLPLLRKPKDTDTARVFAMELAKSPVIASQQESVYRTALSSQPPDIFENIVRPSIHNADAANEAKRRQLGPLAEKVVAHGDAAAGLAVFESGKGSCIACHQIGSKGRPIGPNLSKIGAIRTERDLLESILFPNNTLARDYEAHVIETADGQSSMGVIKSHTAEGLLVVDVAGQEKNIPHGQIVSDTQLTTSLMPMGLDQTLPEKELCDLVAYLRSLK